MYIRLKLSNSVIDIKLALHVSREIVRDILGSIFQGIHNSLSYISTKLNLTLPYEICFVLLVILFYLFFLFFGGGRGRERCEICRKDCNIMVV